MKKTIIETLLGESKQEDNRTEEDVKAHMKNRLDILGRVNNDIIRT